MLPPFQSFLEEHRDQVWRLCLALAGPQEAEDCFQETFLAALRAYPTLRGSSNLRAWVLRIAHSKVMDGHRAYKRRPHPVAKVPDGAGAGAPERDDELWELVRSLPTKQRAAVTYRFALDYSYPEIARLVPCSVDAARRSVHEGVRKLREEMSA